jgi:hypothetical protein
VRVLAQALMDAEVSEQIGAEHSQRTPERVTHRNGYRARDGDTRVGTVELQVPQGPRGQPPAVVSGTTPTRGAGAGRGGGPVLCGVRVDPAGRGHRPGHGDHQPVQVAGLAGLWRAGRAGRRLAQPAVGRWAVRVRVAGRSGDQGP